MDPEIDSTTDLLPIDAASSSSTSSSSSSSCSDIETFPIQQTQGQQVEKLLITQKRSLFATTNNPISIPPIAASSSACSISFPSTPDLITLFDEEMNKNSTDMCQYSELFPYNNVITQALLNCNEVNTLCEQSTSTDMVMINQTAIDNLKALTNLQNHSTNFLSGITLPKTSYNETVRTLESIENLSRF